MVLRVGGRKQGYRMFSLTSMVNLVNSLLDVCLGDFVLGETLQTYDVRDGKGNSVIPSVGHLDQGTNVDEETFSKLYPFIMPFGKTSTTPTPSTKQCCMQPLDQEKRKHPAEKQAVERHEP